MNKKILSLVLALVMVLGTFTTVFAEEAKTEKVEKVVGKENKIQYVIDKKFVEGYGDGDYGYDKNIKRSEITKLLVYANGDQELAEKLQGSMQLYSDVNAEYWANGVISVGSTVPSKANGIPMLNGYPDGTFKGENDVTYAELAKMLVVLVKEDLTPDMVKEANKNWASQWMTWATQLGILDDVNVTNSNAAANRADAFTMLYNALYKMVEFKRVPANDKIGVLSSLRKDKLVLNQDTEQTYTITKDTVFVRAWEGKSDTNSNIINVNDINDPDYYLGSLVRIMVNDKNEVSHILELGNPEVMAIGGDANKTTENDRWEGVADYTVETGLTDITTLKKTTDKTNYYEKGYVILGLKSNKSTANEIRFFDGVKKPEEKAEPYATLKINDDTKVYVANPANNQMREVKDIAEALSLIGFRNYDSGYAVPNVYAGYDNSKYDPSIKGFDNSKDTAKVIVFNVVTKDKGGDVLRVIHSSSYKGDVTLEDTDGKLKDQSFIDNIAHFPYNYGDLYDVIELTWASYNNNYDIVEKRIDHSDYDGDFPVVRVYEKHDNDNIVVEDRFGKQAPIYVGDADIFNAKQYKDLKVGDYLQYENEKFNDAKENNIKTLSILPDTNEVRDKFDHSKSLEFTLDSVQKGTINGTVKEVSVDGTPTVVIDVQYSNWDKVGTGREVFEVSKADADLLANNIGKEVKFIAKDNGSREFLFAYDFESNGEALEPADNSNKVKAYTDAVDAYSAEKDKGITEANIEKLETLLKAVKNAEEQLSVNDMINVPAAYIPNGSKYVDVANEETTELKPIKDNKDSRDQLKAEIKKAEALKASTVESTDGKDVEVSKMWAKTADFTALDTAISTAKTTAEDMTKVKADLDTEKTNLETAVTAFEAARAAGTKAE